MAAGVAAVAARWAAAHVVVDDLDTPELDASDAHHLRSVLRLRRGEAVSATDGRGGWRPCRLGPGSELEPDGETVREERPAPAIAVGFAPVKGDRPEWAVQKLTELGADEILLLRCDRSVVRWDGSRAGGHLDRLRRVARHAVMQSRRVWMPSLYLAGSVEDAAAASPAVALAEPGGDPPSLERPTVLVGPEGGWSPAELGVGLALVDLGPAVMRTETAAVAAGLLLVALRGGLVRPAGA